MASALPRIPQTPASSLRISAEQLSRRQKAAIVVRLLLMEGASISLADLPDSLQADLTEQMGSLRLINRATLRTVIAEFVEELESVGMAFTGGIEGALSVLDGTISPITANRLRKEVGMKAISDPWERISGVETDRLVTVVEQESVEVCAVMLSKIKVAQSAEILGKISGEKARRIAYAMSLTNAVTIDAIDRIGISLVNQLDTEPSDAFDDSPVERIGAILNFSPSGTRDDVLEGLGETDEDFASEVRKAIFTFADIPARVDARDIPKVLRGLDQAILITALTAAKQGPTPEAADFILANMSKRMAEQITEEIEEKGPVKELDGEAAMTSVVAEIRELEMDGEITLIVSEEE